MWRFILVTFAFLGWSFYQLSGGAGYEPDAQSLQAYNDRGKTRPVARPADREDETSVAALDAAGDSAITRPATTLSDLNIEQGARVKVTLTSVSDSVIPPSYDDDPATVTAPADDQTKAEVLTRPEAGAVDDAVTAALNEPAVESEVIWPGAIELFQQQAVAAQNRRTARLDDIRTVNGDLVNMRGGPGTAFDRVAQLTRGTEVAVVEDPGSGWVRLRVIETNQEGWIAGWLLNAAN